MGTSRLRRLVLVGVLAGGLAGCDDAPRRAATPASPHTSPTPTTAARERAASSRRADKPDGVKATPGDTQPLVDVGPADASGRMGAVAQGGPVTRTPPPSGLPAPGGAGEGGGTGVGGIGGGIGGLPGGSPAPAGTMGRGGSHPDQPQFEKRFAQLDATRQYGARPGNHGGYDGLHQEQYRHYQDNAFKDVVREPLSTFSADVNTAGYSNLRRFLADGKMPPPDAVRTAELINFFPYQYARPKGNDPVAFALAAMPCPWEPRHQLVRIGVQARQIDPAEMPARNLVFLIDTSGSMQQHTRLPLVQRSLGLLIDQLTERDTVTIVTYAGSAGVKLPPTPGSQKARIRSVVDGLHAGGSTNGAGGIQVAYEHARMNFLEGGCNRVILCTDGDFNVGVTAEGDLVRTIEKQREGNVFLTILGFGMGNLKDATLEALARHGNGHYAYIDSEAEARKVFVEQGGALTAVAKDVKLQVEFNPAKISSYRLIGYENRLLNTEDFKDDKKDAGDMGSGHTVTVLYEVVPAGSEPSSAEPLKYQHTASARHEARSSEWLTVKMRYKHPESAKSQEVEGVLTAEAALRPADVDFRFAAAVAEFAMLLRESKDRGSANYDRVLAAVGGSIGPDPFGHRSQFAELVKQTRRLTGVQREDAAVR